MNIIRTYHEDKEANIRLFINADLYLFLVFKLNVSIIY